MMMGCSSRARARAYVKLFFCYEYSQVNWKKNGKLFISLSEESGGWF